VHDAHTQKKDIILIKSNDCSYNFKNIPLTSTGFLCAHTLPALYQRYETEVGHLVARGSEDIKKVYKKVDSNLLNKIPRGPVKTKIN
jgi:hypothetical protein